MKVLLTIISLCALGAMTGCSEKEEVPLDKSPIAYYSDWISPEWSSQSPCCHQYTHKDSLITTEVVNSGVVLMYWRYGGGGVEPLTYVANTNYILAPKLYVGGGDNPGSISIVLNFQNLQYDMESMLNNFKFRYVILNDIPELAAPAGGRMENKLSYTELAERYGIPD